MSGELLENIKTLENQPSGKAGGFEGLVERLALLAKQAEDATAHAGTWDWLTLRESGIRAVLAELAKMGVEALPSEGAIAAELWEAAFPIIGKCDWRPCAQKMRAALVVAIAPVIAAKDAELTMQAEEIERLRAEAIPTDEQLAKEAARFVYGSDLWSDATNEQRMRVTKAAHYVICGGDDRSAFGTDVMLYAKGARRAGRPSATQSAAEAPSMNIMSPDD